jgi:t-SNARE complex subunit (syntaxin)
LDEESAEVVSYTKGANVQLAKGVASARKARKFRWILCGICSVVLLGVVVGVVVYFKVILPQQDSAAKAAKDKASGN